MDDWKDATDPVPAREDRRGKFVRTAAIRDKVSAAHSDGLHRQKYLERLRKNGGAKWVSVSGGASHVDPDFDEGF